MTARTIESLCSINPESLGEATPAGFTFDYIDISSVSEGCIDWAQVRRLSYEEAPSRARRCLRTGDVLLCTVRPGLKAHARIEGQNDVPLVGSTGFAVLRPNDPADSGFIFHQLFSDGVAAQLRAMEVGSNYPAVNEHDVRRIYFFTPEAADRHRIAAVLDAVDGAIAKTEAVIAKLRQVRAGLVHDLLTRGLDHNGQLRDPIVHPDQFKDSPLRRIPKDWDVLKFKEACTKVGVGIATSATNHFVRSGVPMLRNQNITERGIDLADLVCIHSTFAEANRSRKLQVGDIVTVRTGYPGLSCVVSAREEGWQTFTTLISRPNLDLFISDFLVLQLNAASCKRQVNCFQAGGAQQNLNARVLETLNVLLVPRTEQEQVLAVVKASEQDLRSEEGWREKLRLARAGLTSDLLTGRVPVPESIEARAV